jgi:hypothetical protein
VDSVYDYGMFWEKIRIELMMEKLWRWILAPAFFDDWMIGDWSIGGMGYTLGLARHSSMIFCYVHDYMHHSPTHYTVLVLKFVYYLDGKNATLKICVGQY